MSTAAAPDFHKVFNPTAAKKPIEAWVTSMGVEEMTWAWEVVRDCMDVVAHHTTPWGQTRGHYKAVLWHEWFGSFLFDTEANHVVHGMVKELRAACPEPLAHGLRRAVLEGYAAGDTRSPSQKEEARRRAYLGSETPPAALAPVAATDARAHPFVVIQGGRED